MLMIRGFPTIKYNHRRVIKANIPDSISVPPTESILNLFASDSANSKIDKFSKMVTL